MPREKVADRLIGCPVANHEAPCHGCGGEWPGTGSDSKKLIKAAEEGKLNPEKLGCGYLTDQAKFLIDFFNVYNDNGVEGD